MKTVIIAFLCAARLAFAAAPHAIRFEQNKGQTSLEYSFLAKARGQTLFFGRDYSRIEVHGKGREVASVRMQFAGANSDSQWTPVGETGRISYLRGSDRSRWVHDAPQYTRLERAAIYPGVDLVLYGHGSNVEYDLILKPGATASNIRLRFDSPWRATLEKEGAIQIRTPAGTLFQKPPRIYQQTASGRRTVQGRFVSAGRNEFRLRLGAYDTNLPLVVDPTIESAAYYGGELDDQIVVVGADYVAGNTSSVDFEGLIGQRRGRDIFVQFNDSATGFPNTGTAASYYIFGGADDDELTTAGPVRASVYTGDPATLYLAGVTKSRDLTVSPSNPSPSGYLGGESDGFVIRFDLFRQSRYSVDVAAAYFGGSGEDRIESLFAVNGGTLLLTGSTTSPDLPVTQPIQANLAGGKDAFVALVYLPYQGGISIGQCSYLGGSGDDIGRAIVFDSAAGIYVAGETRSPDFPAAGDQPGSRNGPSDAFLANLAYDTTSGAYYLKFSRLIGGSGDDSIRALGLTAGNNGYYFASSTAMAIVGVTNSPDFPVVNPVQATLGGGDDAFAMRYVLATGEIAYSTYLGGSGDDAATTVSMRGDLQMVVAGNTRSSDFPVKDPVQAALGGGQDGFLAFLSQTGQIQFSSYYGGAGDENVRSVAPMTTGPARIGGDTTSANLPGFNGPRRKDGGTDGFTADIGVPMILVPDRIPVAKGGITYMTPQLTQSSSQSISVRTLDPAKVRLVSSAGLVDETRVNPGFGVGVEALVDSGEAQIEISIDGFPSRRVNVAMFPMILIVPKMSGSYTLGSTSPFFSVQYCAFNAALNRVEGCGGVRPEATPAIEWTTSDPDVAALIPDRYGRLKLQFLKRGAATITPKSDVPILAPNTFDIVVTGVTPSVPGRIPLGKDVAAVLPISFPTPPVYRLSPVVVRSSDPSLVLVGNDNPGGRGSAATTIPADPDRPYNGLQVPLQVLSDHGEATITLNCPDWDTDLQTTVELRPSYLQINGPHIKSLHENVAAGTGISLYFTPSFDGASMATASNYSSIYSLRPGAPPVQLQLTSSAPQIAAPRDDLVDYRNGVMILAKALGSAVISARAVPPSAIEVRDAFTIDVTPARPAFTAPKELVVGKDLQTFLSLWPYNDGGIQLTYTIADPSVALVSPNRETPGSASLTAGISSPAYIQGLSATGTTQLKITSADGRTSATVGIIVGPSGFGFSARDVRIGSRDTAPNLYVQPFLLDAATNFPIAAMSLRPGVEADLPISTEGNSASLAPTTWHASPGTANSTLDLRPLDVGMTTFTLSTPPGFTPVPRRNRLDVTVVRSALLLVNHAGVQNGVTRTAITGPDNSGAIRIDSVDPSRLLLSNDATGPGAPSITVTRAQPFYLIALAGSGSAAIHVTADGFDPLDDAISLEPLVASFSAPSNSANPSILMIQSGTQPTGLKLSVSGVATSISAIAPGVTLNFALSSSLPGIADVGVTTVSLSGTTREATVPVTGKSPGAAVITARPPAGVTLPNGTVTVNVRAPKLVLTDSNNRTTLRIGKDLLVPVYVQLASPAPPLDNTIARIASLNPDKVMFSRTADGAPAASVSVVIPADGSRPMVYLHALDAAGTYQVLITADGFQDSYVDVTLVPLALSWVTYGRPQIRLGTASDLTVGLSIPDATLRPGAAPFTVLLRTDPAGVAAISPATLTFPLPSNAPGWSARVTPSAVGVFDLIAELPDGTIAKQSVEALPASMSAACDNVNIIGRDLYVACAINTTIAARLSITSSDPSSLLVSTNEKIMGAGKAFVDAPGNGASKIYVQALAGGGRNVSLLMQAPGYQDLTLSFTLRDSGFVVSPNFSLAGAGSSLLSGPVQLTVTPVALSSGPGGFNYTGRIRPGAAPVVTASSSNPKVAILDVTSLTFQGGDGQKQFNIKPGSSGTSIVSISSPPTYPITGPSTILFEVK